jgi:ATP-binding cassette subfamily C protein CydD
MNLDRRLLNQLRSVRIVFAVTILLGFIGGIFILLQASDLSIIIIRAFLGREQLQAVLSLLWWLLAIFFIRAVITFIMHISTNSLALRIKAQLQESLFDKLLQVGPGLNQEYTTGELTAIVTQGIEALDAYFRQYLPQLVLAALIPILMLLFVFPLDLISALVLLFTAPLIPLFMILIGKAAENHTKRQWVMLKRMSSHFLDILRGLTTLKTFNQSKNFINRVDSVSEEYRKTTLSILQITFLSALALELIATISIAIIAVQIGLRLLYGQIDFQKAMFILLIAPDFYLPLRTLGMRFHAGMSGFSAAQQIFEILERPINQKKVILFASPAMQPFSEKPLELALKNVSFTYPGRTQPALDNVTFSLAPGKVTALVGKSGAGKSTIAHILLRFIEPDQGDILLNGKSIYGFEPDEWRRYVGWVSQNPHLFNGSLLENITFDSTLVDMPKVLEAARLAHVDHFVDGLIQGYETPVGESGARLSGGEAKRVALARAFYKKAPLLIMDEPTANLDPDQEALLVDSTHKLIENSTVLMIAHRISSIRKADQIIVLDQGKIIESGHHDVLYSAGGYYHSLVSAYVGEKSL